MTKHYPYYFNPITLPVIITKPGTYLTRCGDIVNVSVVSTRHGPGCTGTYQDGIRERWHWSGRIFHGWESANDIVKEYS